MDTGIISLILPQSMLAHFNIKGCQILGLIETKKECIYIELEEKNDLPNGYSKTDYESKGFYEPKTIQDFPLRGKAVYLVIKRRRWRHKLNHQETLKNDYSFISEGSKLTQELTDFLKGTGRDPRRYDK
jgi:hypothetical protein